MLNNNNEEIEKIIAEFCDTIFVPNDITSELKAKNFIDNLSEKEIILLNRNNNNDSVNNLAMRVLQKNCMSILINAKSQTT